MAKSGKVAIVTGPATGLGAECAVDLAGRGWNPRHQLHQEQEGSRRDLRRGEGQGAPRQSWCRPTSARTPIARSWSTRR
jgi:NAD(P)-dependent dehydrogenase (short-subunit alcohol dehydrogenase family)